MDLSVYISHPERLNRDTLYELRMLVAKYPTFDVARLLMLKNLYLLHDIDLGKEMRKAALYLKNRRPLFELMEGYGEAAVKPATADVSVDRTMALIDAYLETLPPDNLSLEAEGAAAVDYASVYIAGKQPQETDIPELRGQSLIDSFLSGENERITLDIKAPEAEVAVTAPVTEEEEVIPETSFFTETLANIYIKQKKYDKALEIIKRLCLEYPNKNRYFADQIRFLEKIVKHTKK